VSRLLELARSALVVTDLVSGCNWLLISRICFVQVYGAATEPLFLNCV